MFVEYFKVFQHNIKGGVFKSKLEAMNVNPNDPENDLFSILDQLEDYRSVDGNFRFKLCYPDLEWGVDGETCNYWIQSSNPTMSTVVEGYQAIKTAFNLQNWKGLVLSDREETLIGNFNAEAITYSK